MFFLIPASLILSAGLSGCYGDIDVTCELPGQGFYDPDSINLFFFISAEVKRPARGISAFPDGGIPKSLFKKVTLCRFNTIQKSLVTISALTCKE